MHQFIDLRKNALDSEDGEFVFGAEHTGSHACYMIYGVLQPGEKNRLVKPGRGHEEMVLAADGDLEVTGAAQGRLKQGEAFYIAEEQTAYLENPADKEAVYVIAGGHGEQGHHH
ncbi:MAG: hypothetical protein K9J85_07450 [Desulfobacteraceae bacterium]|nr:hypothetical protein [Desulfobacteraceae bacterium]